MKRIISLVLVTTLLLSLFSVTAFAAEKPEPTVGPAQDVSMYGGACVGIYEPATYRNRYVVNYNYSEGGGLTINNRAVPGATYDLASNTLTVDNVHQKGNELFIWYMGDDFKLNVVGENEFGVIYVYNYFNFYDTSLNIVGDGSLTVNKERINVEAIHLYAEGEGSLMHLDIADSVNVHLYSQEAEDGEQPYSVVGLKATAITPDQGGAITVGGKTAPEAKSEQIVEERSDTVSAVMVEDRYTDVPHGKQLKSKSDPEGTYALTDILDGVTYVVTRYIYVDELGMWAPDYSFAEGMYVGHRCSKAEFEAEYEYVYGQAPTPIKYMEAYKEDLRGNLATKLTKDGEPDAVYVALQTGGEWDWADDDSYSGGYGIKRVLWDDKQEIYVEDPSFEDEFLWAYELETNGYHIVKETVDEQLELSVWTTEDPSDQSRFEITSPVLNRKSDPDGLYVKIGTYSSSSGETGISICKVHYNPETDDHYVMYYSHSSDEWFYETDADIESGVSDFSYAVETKTKHVKLRYLPVDYDINRDLVNGVQLKKNDEPDVVYAYKHWTHYMWDDTEREEYGIFKLLYNDKLGCYVEDIDFEEVDFYDLDDLEWMGYEVVMSEQPLDFVTRGSVYFNDFDVYTDKGGSTYYVDYEELVYSFTDEDIITISGKDYYYGIPMPGVNVYDLNDTVHEVVTDSYSYWIDGPEYHHIAGDQPAPSKYLLSGKLESFLDDSGYVRINLHHVAENWDVNMMVPASEGEYFIDNLPAGAYTMTVGKKNHVDREYEVNIKGNTELDVKICPIGDINLDGDVTMRDYAKAYKHVQEIDEITDPYAFRCGDVNGNDGEITMKDYRDIYKHVQELGSLWA